MSKAKEVKDFKMSRDEYIAHLATKTNKIHMTTKNKKTGPAILDLAFPVCTCRDDAPCKETCYACKGTQKITIVQAAYYRNWRLWNENPDNFFEQVFYEIKYSGLTTVRFFDSGDFPNYDFLERVISLCEKTPDIKYMAFTKQYEIVNDYIFKNGKLPNNLNIVFSAWDKLWEVPNPHELPVAYVEFKDKRMNPDFPKNSFRCPMRESTCSACKVCWNKNLKAVIFKQH